MGCDLRMGDDIDLFLGGGFGEHRKIVRKKSRRTRSFKHQRSEQTEERSEFSRLFHWKFLESSSYHHPNSSPFEKIFPPKIQIQILNFAGGLLSTISMGLIGGTENNDAKLDNRASYLLLKGSTLRTMDRTEEAMACLNEVIFRL